MPNFTSNRNSVLTRILTQLKKTESSDLKVQEKKHLDASAAYLRVRQKGMTWSKV
jgi:hypothetical protein